MNKSSTPQLQPLDNENHIGFHLVKMCRERSNKKTRDGGGTRPVYEARGSASRNSIARCHDQLLHPRGDSRDNYVRMNSTPAMAITPPCAFPQHASSDKCIRTCSSPYVAIGSMSDARGFFIISDMLRSICRTPQRLTSPFGVPSL